MLKVTSSGSFDRTFKFLDTIIRGDIYSGLEPLAKRGLDALVSQTPQDSGLTAASWEYEIIKNSNTVTIWWSNTNVVNGFNVAIGLQYGHGTGTGGYVAGEDYINPALRPVFDKIAAEVWEEVQRA